MQLHLDFMYKERSLAKLPWALETLIYHVMQDGASICVSSISCACACACVSCLMWIVTIFEWQTHEATPKLHLQPKNLVCLPLHCLRLHQLSLEELRKRRLLRQL